MRHLLVYVVTITLVFIGSAYLRTKSEVSKLPSSATIAESMEALRWRLPGENSKDKIAKDNLSKCAFNDGCNEQLDALRGLRQGITASRSWLTYNEDKALLEHIQNQEEKLIGKNPITVHNKPVWNVYFQVMAQVALWIWIVSVLLFIWKGVGSDGSLNLISLTGFFCLWLGGFTGWLYLLSLA